MNYLNMIKAHPLVEKAQNWKDSQQGSVAGVIGGLVVGVVMLFVGLFMISVVADATAINNSSDFYTTYTDLVSTTGTIFTVLGLVIIVIALATAIGSLRNVQSSA